MATQESTQGGRVAIAHSLGHLVQRGRGGLDEMSGLLESDSLNELGGSPARRDPHATTSLPRPATAGSIM